jgi:Tfp pilus assembly protein PilO
MANDNALVRAVGRIPFGLVTFGIALYFGWQFYDLTQSAESPLATKRAEIDATKQEVEGLSQRLQEVEKFARSLNERRQRLAAIKGELEARKEAVPEELDPVDFTRTVTRMAEDVGLRVSSMQPEGRVRGEYYVAHPFALEFSGVYIQVFQLFQQLAALPMIVRIDSFSLKPEGSLASRFVPLRGSLRLAAFSYVKSEADAVGVAPASVATPKGEGQ